MIYYTFKTDTCSLIHDFQKISDTFYMVVAHAMIMCDKEVRVRCVYVRQILITLLVTHDFLVAHNLSFVLFQIFIAFNDFFFFGYLNSN